MTALSDILTYIDQRIAQYKARGERDAAMALGVLRGDPVARFHEREAAAPDAA